MRGSRRGHDVLARTARRLPNALRESSREGAGEGDIILHLAQYKRSEKSSLGIAEPRRSGWMSPGWVGRVSG